jgi:hypothetical protein
MSAASDPSIGTKIQHVDQGDSLVVKSGGIINIEAGGAFKMAGVSMKMARGEIALDGANPTPISTGLSTIASASATLKRTTALSSGTAFVTVDFTGSDGTLNLYGWVLAGSASSGTESVEWIAWGT